MSKEREMSEKIRYKDAFPNSIVNRYKDVCQEPVAWMNDSGGCFLSDGNKYSENWIALYTAPPKREPLTPQQISVGNQSMFNVTREAFKQGVKFAEKHHNIGGGE